MTKYIGSDKHFLQLLLLTFLIITIPTIVFTVSRGNFKLRTSASSGNKSPTCYSSGGVCVSGNSCGNRGGTEWGKWNCTGDKICCYEPKERLEYEGNNLRVYADCTVNSTLNMSIIDNGINELPYGTWSYIINLDGEYVFMAYVGSDGGNSGSSIYNTAYSIRGSAKLTLQPQTKYTVGVAHAVYNGYLETVPTLVNPRYELEVTTPPCK